MDQQETVTKNEVRQGETPHITRYVLLTSLILIVVAFGALLLIWQ